MPTKDDQYIPTISEFNLFQDQVLKSKLNEIEKEMKENIGVQYLAVAKGKEEFLCSSDQVNGVCKVCFFNTFSESRKIIYAALRINPDQNKKLYIGVQ